MCACMRAVVCAWGGEEVGGGKAGESHTPEAVSLTIREERKPGCER